jgi:hypothetical protein
MTRWSLFDLFELSGRAHKNMGMPNSLFGYFELRVDQIVGWVKNRYESDVASVQVEMLCRGCVIATCTAMAQPENHRFVFSVPVESRFTGADLVRECVTLIARDSDGNSGHLLLDGAAQLELIREHLGVPAVTILDLDFSRGGNVRPYLGVGWYEADANCTWTRNDDSFISFNSPREPGTYALRVTAGSFIRKPDLPVQELKLFINETEVAHTFSNDADGHVRFEEHKFPHEAFTRASTTTLRLHHPDARRPIDLGINGDTRRLAFSLKRVTLARLLSQG